jgi:ESS family glutamate:Na+ symporter
MTGRLLRELSIPEPVTGGLLFSLLFALLYLASGTVVEFELRARDVLLVYFFTTIGINASGRGPAGRRAPFMILLLITIAFMFAQNMTGISVAALFDLPGRGGRDGRHRVADRRPRHHHRLGADIAEQYGIANAMEIGIASATFGLILASLMGGPIARFLINRHALAPAQPGIDEVQEIGLSENRSQGIDHMDFLAPYSPSMSPSSSATSSTSTIAEAGAEAAAVRDLPVRRHPADQPGAGEAVPSA